MREGENPILSPAGRERREAILARCQSAVAARRRTRLATRGTAGLAMVAAAGIAWLGVQPLREAPDRPAIGHSGPGAGESPAPPQSPGGLDERSRGSVELVQSEPDIVERLAARPPEARAQRLSDEELLRELGELGVPAGLVRIGDNTRLVRHDDEEPHGPTSALPPADDAA